jgi:sensor histidine kinase regulating citrate/malate metabolism
MLCIVIVDLYYLYFNKYSFENNQLKFELQLLEQQSVLKYEYYTAQEKKYFETLKIIDDVNNHIKKIQTLCTEQGNTSIWDCTNAMEKLLEPITPHNYISNSLLNIVLDDKKKNATLNNIDLNIEIGAVDLEFMEPIEITTLFGNLLDNAMEACEKVHAERTINMKLRSYHNFVVLDISNSSYYVKSDSTGNPVPRMNTFPHGIGLTNVRKIIDKYNGDLKMDWSKGRFNCSVIFNS